jgi:hypothetical protein
MILQRLRRHLYTAIDAIATPATFEFSARHHDVQQGGMLPRTGGTLHVRTNAPQEFTTTIWNGNRVLTTGSRDGELTIVAPRAGGLSR